MGMTDNHLNFPGSPLRHVQRYESSPQWVVFQLFYKMNHNGGLTQSEI